MSARLSGKIKNEKRPSKKRIGLQRGGGGGFSSFELTERIIKAPAAANERTSSHFTSLLPLYFFFSPTCSIYIFPSPHSHQPLLVHLHRIVAPSALARRIYLGISVPVDPGHHACSTLEGLN